MVSKINKILYATDLSENSRPALEWAFLMAQRYDAKVVLFHCAEGISLSGDGAIKSYLGDQRCQATEADIKLQAAGMMKKRVELFCEEAKTEITSCPFLVDDIVVARGYSVDRIICAAEESGCDIVVMGTHNSRKLFRRLMGSTAQRIIQRCRKPVFVVPL